MAGTLQLGRLDGRPVYFLDGEALHYGDTVAVLLANGTWLAGVYEWAGQEFRWPGLRFALGGNAPSYMADTCRTAVVALPPDAVLRRCSVLESGDDLPRVSLAARPDARSR